MSKMNHQKRNRQSVWAQERRHKAEQLMNNDSATVKEADLKDKKPATPAQIAVIVKHNMIDINEVSYLSVAKASSIISAWAEAHGWSNAKKKPKAKKKPYVIGAHLASDIKVTNMNTGEVRIEKNPARPNVTE
jgi:sensor c-di-GMP phosphodiesterase-like protein